MNLLQISLLIYGGKGGSGCGGGGGVLRLSLECSKEGEGAVKIGQVQTRGEVGWSKYFEHFVIM